jgi:hypothetical protein
LEIQTNVVMNEGDDAAMQRTVLVPFEAMENKQTQESMSAFQVEWSSMKDIISCCMPDLEQLLWKGKLDREAISDCVAFVNKACDSTMGRNPTLYGYLLYYRLMIERLTQAGESQYSSLFQWFCSASVRQVCATTRSSSSSTCRAAH